MATEGAKEIFLKARSAILNELHGSYGVPRIDARALQPSDDPPVGEGRFAEVFEVSLVSDNEPTTAEMDESSKVPRSWTVAVKVVMEDKIDHLLSYIPPYDRRGVFTKSREQPDKFQERARQNVGKLLDYYKRECVVWQKCSGDPKKARENNIVELLGLAESYQGSHLPAFVSRFIHEGNILSYIMNLTKPGLSDKHRILIVSDIANALKFLHGIGIAHRDINPRNILIEDSGERYAGLLGDFGSSKMFEGDFLQNASSTIDQDRYSPPEYLLIRGAQHEDKGTGDIWALGCTFLEIMQEQEPWRPYLPEEFKPMLCEYRYPMTGESVTINSPRAMTFRHVDERCYELMKKCWRRKPTERISAADLYAELLMLAERF